MGRRGAARHHRLDVAVRLRGGHVHVVVKALGGHRVAGDEVLRKSKGEEGMAQERHEGSVRAGPRHPSTQASKDRQACEGRGPGRTRFGMLRNTDATSGTLHGEEGVTGWWGGVARLARTNR